MINLLNSAVMNALMSAESHSRMNKLCTSVAEKSEGDGAYQRAMGYAVSQRDEALSAVERAGEALADSVQEARMEQNLEQKRSAERGTEAAAVREAAPAGRADGAPKPAATLELSQAYRDSLQAETAAEAGPAETAAPEAPAHTPQAPKSPAPAKAAAGAVRPIFFLDRKA